MSRSDHLRTTCLLSSNTHPALKHRRPKCEGPTDCAACDKKRKCHWFLPHNSDKPAQCMIIGRCRGMKDGNCYWERTRRGRVAPGCPRPCRDHSEKMKCINNYDVCRWITENKSCVDLMEWHMCVRETSCLSCVALVIESVPGVRLGGTKTKRADVCKWFPESGETGSCLVEGGTVGLSQNYCDCKDKRIEWPELVDATTDDAREAIEGDCPTHEVITVLEGTVFTDDPRKDRVRIFHGEELAVSQTPRIG